MNTLNGKREKRILVAGIGNIFCGDDAFGGETVRALAQRRLPREVRAVDFGIRSYDVAYALTDGYDMAILVDAMARGEPPGTVALIAPDLEALPEPEPGARDAHGMSPVTVLQMARTLGDLPAELYLVGCEPAVLESEDGQMGLSQVVQAAVPRAVAMLEALIGQALDLTGVNYEREFELGN